MGNFFFFQEKNRLQVFNFLRQDFPETPGLSLGDFFVNLSPRTCSISPSISICSISVALKNSQFNIDPFSRPAILHFLFSSIKNFYSRCLSQVIVPRDQTLNLNDLPD